MDLQEVRKRYLEFFKVRGHTIIPSVSLVPENDPTTLFTGSGMQPLLPYLLGSPHPAGSRLVDSQKCFRSMDIEEVGDNRHTTFFEMLGNWSLGDYFKKEQLRWFFEFLTDKDKGIGLAPDNLYVTVFSGDAENGISRDSESVGIWKALFKEKGIDAPEVELLSEEEGGRRGMQGGRIFFYNAKKNWWSRAGVPQNMPAGEPGGPDSEVFYDFGTPHNPSFGQYCHPNCDCGRFMEIGNSVFMEYIKRDDGTFATLPKKNVDFGGGLERITAAGNKNPDVFRTNTIFSIIQGIEQFSDKRYGRDGTETRSFRIIADHLRGAVFMIGDGISPGNTDRNYFVRRLLRRAVRHMDLLEMKAGELSSLCDTVIGAYADVYPMLQEGQQFIKDEIAREETQFRKTLGEGLKKLQGLVFAKLRVVNGNNHNNVISGEEAFDLYQAYGFPQELIEEELAKRAMTYDKIVFEKAFNEAKLKHQETSRAGSLQKFKGGLADHSEMSVKYHTATHLLHKALRDVLGGEVYQKGSNITPERLRFDFSFPRKMTAEEVQKVEALVNEKISAALPVSYEDISLEEAKKRGAIGLFEEKYGDTVRVYKVGSYSLEFCGGPHVENTLVLGNFKITKEEAVSSGVRRIKATLL